MEGNNPEDKSLAYDLRQIYVKIVGEHLQDIAEARKSENFYIWFKNLEDLHTIIKHKFSDDGEDEKEYNKLKDTLIELSNKFKEVWLGTSKNGEAHASIEEKLRLIEMFLYKKMDEVNMFGRYIYDEDEI